MAIKVITTVGTSLATNYKKYYSKFLKNYLSDISHRIDKTEGKTLSDAKDLDTDIRRIEKALGEWLTEIVCL